MYLSGAFIFFNGILSAILGLTVKCLVNEPGESHLASPIVTMLAYCTAMAGMGLAGYLSHRIRRKNSLLPAMAEGDMMKHAAQGCLALGILVQLLTLFGNHASGSILSVLRQLNYFTLMAILLATVYEVRRTGGTRSTNWVVFIGGIWLFCFGLVGFSKEGMFTPLVLWLLPSIAMGYNFSKKQLIVGAFVVLFGFYYLVPYSQVVRNFRSENNSLLEDIHTAEFYLSDLKETRKLYLVSAENGDDYESAPHFYRESQGLFDRLEMLAYDDALITVTDQGTPFGLGPVYFTYINIVPHFLWPSKPTIGFGNVFAHEIGVLAENDETTGISFSPVGEAYHEAAWWGVGLLLPGIVFLLFLVTDSLAGDVRISPWGFLPISVAVNVAPEGGLTGAISMTTYGAVVLILVALLSRYVFPLLWPLVIGGSRTRVRPTMNFDRIASTRKP